MSLSFLVPAFLAGLLALAIPVLIHLSRRQAKDPVQFPSLMFLRRIPQQTEQRRQIHRWPLLLLRLLALLLLILAFARPFVDREGESAAAPATGDREVVILVDHSYSMGIGDRWERAVAAGLEAVNGLTGGDRGTVILFDSGTESATQSTVDKNVLAAVLRGAEPGTYSTRYAPALRYAGRLLASSPLPRHEMVVISDFQAAGWDMDSGETSSIRLPAGTVVTPISVADAQAEYNVTIGDADLQRSTAEDRERVTVVGRLSGSGSPPPSLPVTLEIDGRVIETRVAAMDEGNSARVQFSPLTLPQAGVTRGTLRVRGEDLATDNALHFVLSSDQRMGVLIVEGPGATEGSSFFLERALSLGEEPGFRPTVRRSSQITATDLAANSVIILNQASFPAGEQGERLRRHVQEGGGVVMILGDNSLGTWADIVPSVPPAVDRSSIGGTTIGYVDTGHPVFEAFAGPRSGDFSAARIYRYRPVPSNAFPRVLARYGDGGVALAERPVEDGRVLVWSSTLDSDWNDLVLQPVFLPFLHQLVKYAAGYSPPRSWLTVGDPFDPRAVAPIGEQFDLALTPSGEQIDLTETTAIELDEVGFYELRNSGNSQSLVSFAVNVDPAEAEPTGFDPEEMRSALLASAADPANVAGGGELSLAELERRQNAWWYLIVVAFALLAAETFFSNQKRRAATGALWSRMTRRRVA